MAEIDWEKDEIKVVYSSLFEYWGHSAVSLFRKTEGGWQLCLADMSPTIIKRANFPKALCEAAGLTANDEKSRVVKSGSIKVVKDLFIPPPKPKLYMPKAKLYVP